MHTRGVVSAAAVLILFCIACAGASVYGEELKALAMVDGTIGMVLYVGVTIIATVAAPLASLPLIPVASAMWGPFSAALLSILGWIIGAIIAFYIARRYGRVVAKRVVSLDRADVIADRVLGTNHIMSVILLRMVIPVDVLSYALGLVGTLRFRDYFVGTCIGVVPFAFIFAYMSQMETTTLVSVLVTLGALLLLVYQFLFRDSDDNTQ